MGSATRDDAINCLFQPRSVAIVGASSDPSKWGYMLAKSALTGVHRRTVSFVNRSGSDILGHPSVARVTDIADVPDLAVVAVPERIFEQTIDDVLAIGTRAIVAVTAGFGELGDEGRQRQEAFVQKVRDHDGVLLGPNCNGTFDAAAEFSSMAWAQPAGGSIGIISQSGSVILDLAVRLERVGLGISRAASLGNQADVNLGDLVRNCAKDEATRAMVVYIEDAIDGRSLFREIAAATAAGTPVIVLTPDSHEAVNRAAMSHTGALMSSQDVIEEATRKAGALRVSSFAETVHMVQAVLSPVRAPGYRTAIVADGGGFGVLGASAAAQAGLDVPSLPPYTQDILAKQLMPGAGVTNPVDLVGIMDVRDVPSMLSNILDGDGVDGALVNIAAFVHDTPELEQQVGRELADVAIHSGKPIVLSVTDSTLPGPKAAAEAGVPVYQDMQPAALALAALAQLHRVQPAGPPEIPSASNPLALAPEDYLGAREALAAAGVPFARVLHAATPEAAVEAAESLGFPVVVKALGLLHKSDAGGVALGLDSTDTVNAAVTRMHDALHPTGFAVEQMVSINDSVELIVGAHQDPRFGPVLLIGLGGIYSEILRDTALLLAPTTEDAVIEKLLGLRGASLLLGARGKPAIDLQAIAQNVVRIGQFIAEHPEIHELDVNPLLAGPSELVALDARIVI
ncbi:acetate--CoA ligase family protein [Rhodococcus sp. KBS0724]|uniref:acetate--CoA ligase family protein n=1 Tax=Rhodococcus sp. KBS0724 TaxID=1179674 RepID=UPI00110EAA54|nr:acetate--CoA ligase family protein [Rhodococcus sp. KBS0724]TSD40414.1 acetate--CoA ligase family protein [Rhodococcus sp. KBS0724]